MKLIDYITDMKKRAELAAAMETSPDYLWQLAKGWKGRTLQPDQCRAIEYHSGGQVTCEEMRPDLVWHRDDDCGHVTAFTTEFPATPTLTGCGSTAGAI